jgi:hypothetical protein
VTSKNVYNIKSCINLPGMVDIGIGNTIHHGLAALCNPAIDLNIKEFPFNDFESAIDRFLKEIDLGYNKLLN